jgi:hypothetical protein
MRRARATVIASVAAAVLFAGCSSGGGGSGSAVSSTRAAKTVTVDEHARGTRVTLVVGDNLVVVLHSTYWQLPAPQAGVLVTTSAPVAQPAPGCSRIPGIGCGTATATYAARRAGSTTITAHRDSCGEALRCTGTEGDWSIKVDVHA